MFIKWNLFQGLNLSLPIYVISTAGGTGWTFSPATESALLDAVSSAVELLTEDRKAWSALQSRAMAKDCSWDQAAALYSALFSGMMAGSFGKGA